MGYLPCPQCGSVNRDTDPNCFSCNADLTAVPPPPPPPTVPMEEAATPGVPELDLRVSRISDDKVDQGRFKDLASRYEAKPLPKMDSGVEHGLRSGLIGGLLIGAILGMLRLQMPDDFTYLIIRHFPGTAKAGMDIFIFTLVGDVFFGLFLGALLGFRNQLCWQPESGRTGLVFGLLISLGVYYHIGHIAQPVSIAIGTIHGYILAWIISGIERKLFRGM